MKRRPIPELMAEAAQALAYAQADFPDANPLFLDLLRHLDPGNLEGKLALDLGCGPGDISIRLLKAWPGARCDALDGSAPMLASARTSLSALPGIAQRCRLLHEVLPSTQLAPDAYDLVLSNGLLHQLQDPQVLWQTLRAAGRPGALVLIMDLMRPPSPGWAESLVVAYRGEEPAFLQDRYRASLFAAFEPTEVQAQLTEAGLEGLAVGVVSDRHLAVSGRLPG